MLKTNEFKIRDPFILPCDGTYYLYASDYVHDFMVYTSKDLDNWTEPVKVTNLPADHWGTKDFWAPEVHEYKGKFYLFGTMYSDHHNRGTQIFRSDSPMGPFVPISDGAVTPKDWMCLDGTLFVEDGKPYIVFCHEWLQVKNGAVCCAQLSDDLTCLVSEPKVLFRAKDYDFVRHEVRDPEGFVTDGPFLHRCSDGTLTMIWSSFGEKGYLQSVLYSDNGGLNGRWLAQELLFETDGGHGMIFRDFAGRLKLALHYPNSGPEHLKLFNLTDEKGKLRILE